MTIGMGSTMVGDAAILQRDMSVARRLTAGVAALVLSLATGLPLRSAEHFLPEPEETATPFLGI